MEQEHSSEPPPIVLVLFRETETADDGCGSDGSGPTAAAAIDRLLILVLDDLDLALPPEEDGILGRDD